jgi:hypothetical protein
MRWWRMALLGYFLLFLPVLALLGSRWHGRQVPPQPIAYSHEIHAGRLALPCTFCHAQVENSPEATVPPVATCLNCHRTVATDRPEVQKLLDYERRGEAIHWQRVHALPDFIYFTHKRHVRAGVDCASCHGQIARMAVVRRAVPLQMGWCITCHRARGAPTDCATCHR